MPFYLPNGTARLFDMPPSGLVCRYKDISYWVYLTDHPRPHFTAYVDGRKYKYEIFTLRPVGSPPNSKRRAAEYLSGLSEEEASHH